jgi:hypothetical protein
MTNRRHKTKKHSHSRHYKNKQRNTRKKYNKRRNLGRGPKPIEPISLTGPVQCCMCNETHRRDNMLAPSDCLQKNRERAHRICQDCWWNKFARENGIHRCPGCANHVPLAPPLKRTKPKSDDIIEISDS